MPGEGTAVQDSLATPECPVCRILSITSIMQPFTNPKRK